jgi:hypothetical protein
MKTYKFRIGSKTLELTAPSIDSAYLNAESYKVYFGWKGKVTLVEIK